MLLTTLISPWPILRQRHPFAVYFRNASTNTALPGKRIRLPILAAFHRQPCDQLRSIGRHLETKRRSQPLETKVVAAAPVEPDFDI